MLCRSVPGFAKASRFAKRCSSPARLFALPRAADSRLVAMMLREEVDSMNRLRHGWVREIGPLASADLEARRYRSFLHRMEREYAIKLSTSVRLFGRILAERELEWLQKQVDEHRVSQSRLAKPRVERRLAQEIRLRSEATRTAEMDLDRLDVRSLAVTLLSWTGVPTTTAVVRTTLQTHGSDFRHSLLGAFSMDICPRLFSYSVTVALGDRQEASQRLAVGDHDPIWVLPGGQYTLEDYLPDVVFFWRRGRMVMK